MNLKNVEKTINGNKYQVIKFGAVESITIASKVTKMLEGSPISVEEDIMGLIFRIVGNADFVPVMQQLCTQMTCNGVSFDFDSHFRENEKDLIPVIAFSFQESVMPFFDMNALETLFATETETPESDD